MSAVDKAIKLGFLLSASDEMSKVIQRSVEKSMKNLNTLESRCAAISQNSMIMGKRMIGVGTAIAAGMYESTQKVGDYAQMVTKASQKTGLGVEDFQKFAYAAKRCNIDSEQFTSAISKLNKKIVEFREKGDKATTVFKDLNIRTDNVRNTLLDTAKAFAKAKDGPGKTATAMEIFGKAGADLIPFLNMGEAGIEQLMKQAEKMGIILDTETTEAANDFNTKLEELQGGLKGASMQLGVALIPTVQKAIEKITEIVQKVTDWIKNNRELLDKIINLTKGFGKFLLIGGGVLTLFGGIVGTVLKVGGVITGAITIVKGISKAFLIAKNSMLLFKIQYYALVVGQKLAAAAQWLFNASLFGCPIVWIIAGIAAVVAAVILMVKHWDKITAFFKNLWEKIKIIFSKVWEWIKNLFFKYHPVGLIITHWDKITNFFSNLWNKITGIFSSTWEGIKTFFTNLNPIEWLQSIGSKISAWFIELKNNFFEYGKSIIQGLIDGIKAMFSKITEAISNIGAAIKDKFTNLLGINSPSKIFAQYGLNITQGLTGGIEHGSTDVASATGSLAMQTVKNANSNITNNSSNAHNIDSKTFGGVTVHYAPVINVTGTGTNSSVQQDIMQSLRSHKYELAKLLNEVFADQKRLAFSYN